MIVTTSSPIAYLTEKIAETLGLVKKRFPIYLGESNIEHMKQRHPADYAKYGSYIPEILNQPDYVGINPNDNSIAFVKEFKIDGEYVKVAVRISSSGILFARSLYTITNNKINNYIKKGSLKPLDK